MARLPLPPAENIQLRSLAELSHGGMGTIELARVEEGKREGELFAVKRLHERYAKDPQFVAMFLDEAWMTAALKNPNVVQVAAWGTDDRGMFLAVELVEGVSLRGLLRAARQRKDMISERTVAFIASEICGGLAAAHDLRGADGAPLGLIHRDLTASNVLVSFRGDVKIADFGIAKARARITHTETGMLKGKPGCMAPEQARGQEMDHRADIFSLGVLVFELLAGRRPWIADTPIELMLEAAQEPPPDLTKLRRGCDPALVAIVNKCLEKDPNHRPQSALGVKALIDEWRAEKGFVGGERASLAKFVLRTCEPQVEWFKHALAGDLSKASGATFKDLEEQVGGPSVIPAPRRSRPNVALVAEMAEGGEPAEPTPSAPETAPAAPKPSGPARFSFVARWASTAPEREKEGMTPPTGIPRPVPLSREETPAVAPKAPMPTMVAPQATTTAHAVTATTATTTAPKPTATTGQSPLTATAPQAPTTAAPPTTAPKPTTAPQPTTAPKPPPTTTPKPRAGQETLKSNEVIPDLLRAISGAQAPIQRPPKKPPPTVRVTAATATAPADESNLSNNKQIPSDSDAEAPTTPVTTQGLPMYGSGGSAPTTPRDVSLGAIGAQASPTPPGAATSEPSKDGPSTLLGLNEPLSVDSIPTPPPAPPPPVPMGYDEPRADVPPAAVAPVVASPLAASPLAASPLAPSPPAASTLVTAPTAAAPLVAPPAAKAPPKPAYEQLIAANSGKSAHITLASRTADDEIDAGPQPTMKSPHVSPSVAPAPQPPVDVRVSAPSPLPPPQPQPAAPISPGKPPRRRTDPGRTRISALPAKPMSPQPATPAPAARAGQSPGELRSAIVIALVALIAGALLAFLIRGRF